MEIRTLSGKVKGMEDLPSVSILLFVKITWNRWTEWRRNLEELWKRRKKWKMERFQEKPRVSLNLLAKKNEKREEIKKGSRYKSVIWNGEREHFGPECNESLQGIVNHWKEDENLVENNDDERRRRRESRKRYTRYIPPSNGNRGLERWEQNS